MRISDWSSDVCSSDLEGNAALELARGDLDVDDATDSDSVEATARDLTHRAEIVCRCAGDDADRATDGGASEQRTLRALQDLDAFHVGKIYIRPGGTREVDTIDIGADARVEVECEVVLADAADESGQHRWRTEHLRRGR